MSKKRKITAWVIVCLLWESVVVGLHIFICSRFKFPTLNPEFFAWIIPVFMAVPFLTLVFGIVSIDKNKLIRVLAKIFAVIAILIYGVYFYFVGSFPPLYPIMSDTKNSEDYLVFDSDIAWLYGDIIEVIPESIPENATNVVYNYRFEPALDAWMYVYWELPEDEYEAFKNETLQKDGVITEDSRGIIFNPLWNGDGFPSTLMDRTVWMDLILNDDNNSVICNFRQNYAC